MPHTNKAAIPAMIRTLRFGRNIANKMLKPLGIEVLRVRKENPDVSLYEEKERPVVPRYINIGAGAFYHPYWHNVDTPNEYYAESQKGHLHIQYDLTSHRPFPFADNSIKVAYTSHVIEHIRDEDVQYLFQEVYRYLQPGGYFRITCPDMDLEYDAFCRGDASFWRWPNAYGVHNSSIEQKFLDHFATILTETHPHKAGRKFSDHEVRDVFSRLSKEEAMNFVIEQIPDEMKKGYPGDHVNWFNRRKIEAMLRKAGFTNIFESKYGQSHCPILRDKSLFDSTVPELSLYVECQK